MKLVYDNKINEIEDELYHVDLQDGLTVLYFKDTADADKIFVEFKKIFDNVEHRHSEYYGDYITISIL